MRITKDNLKDFRNEFERGEVIAIEVDGYPQPVICQYLSAFTPKDSNFPKIRTTYGIDCHNRFDHGHKYGIGGNNVRKATPHEINRLICWMEKFKNHSTEVDVAARLNIIHQFDLNWDGSGYIYHTPDVSIEMNGRTYDMLYIGIYDNCVQVYLTEIDIDGCDCNPILVQWCELPVNIQTNILFNVLR